MLAEYKTRTNLGVGLGILVQAIGGSTGGALGLLIVLGGGVLFIWGCWSYAQGKGYHGAWGLLGLLSLLGLVVLVCFPDRHKWDS